MKLNLYEKTCFPLVLVMIFWGLGMMKKWNFAVLSSNLCMWSEKEGEQQ